jgi:hypothetical protein
MVYWRTELLSFDKVPQWIEKFLKKVEKVYSSTNGGTYLFVFVG